MVRQGDILKIEGIKDPVLVLSKDRYNESERIIGCPATKEDRYNMFQVEFDFEGKRLFAQADSVKKLDISQRGYRVKGSMPLGKLMIVNDMIISIIDII